MAMRPLLVIDNVPVSLFVQITMIEFSPLSCWIVAHFQVLTAVPFDQLIAQLLTLSLSSLVRRHRKGAAHCAVNQYTYLLPSICCLLPDS